MIKNAQQIRNEINIVDIIGTYVTLKSKGIVMVGLCPFHEEKSPSFTVYQTTNTFKCFGCGEGGDAIHFLMEKQGMTYAEALEEAAKVGKIDVEYENSEKRKEIIDREKAEQAHRQALQDTLFSVHHYLEHQGPLPTWSVYPRKGDTTEQLCDADGRLLHIDTVQTFGMCMAPASNAIHDSRFWDSAKLHEIGLVGKGEHSEYDFFRNRLLFRITDHRGRISGLAGRRRRSDDAANKYAKFLNPKESLLYNKSEILFGLWENRRGIKEAGYAILVEGYMDVVTPHDYGVKCMVAPCGTALTDQQAKTLKRYTDEVIILRDGDSAGFEAAKRDVEILVRAGLKV